MDDAIRPGGEDLGEAVVRVFGLVTMVAGIGAFTGVGLPAVTGLLGHFVAAAAVVRGAVLSYVAPDPRTTLATVREAVPVGGA